MTNPALISDFVLKSDNINLVRVPLRKLEETDIIAVAREGKHLNIRVEAIGLIHDQDVLSEIALSGGTEGRAAMEELQDTDALKRVYEGTADMNIKAIAIEKCGGYLCSGCGAVVWPSADVENPCACPACGTMNHHWEYVDDVTEYRDYSVGTTYDRCTRCGERKNVRHINTL